MFATGLRAKEDDVATNGNVNVSVGSGFWGLLTLLFIGLKLGGVIGWSWWWVLSPMWLGLALLLLIVLVVAVVALAHK